ncbi:hypothetical protein SKAU_G00079700 [Synaphobranchus kaupii]|uniref:Cadherin domain-containing protein n=1 Tax=Synaphobranchus kaupii TaxID=118154 RepID=A0A9Q1FUV1_SYNKA|nr:hypothetical protein SKAU_G00079700 [Synaphobranchus kaupii]
MVCAFSTLPGIIYTTDMLDRETKDSYWLTIYATDRGVVPLFTAIEIYIQVEDVNDNAPLTSEPIYRPSVVENSPRDVSVIQIQAQDPDATTHGDRLSFRISSGNPQNFFAINSKTGFRLSLGACSGFRVMIMMMGKASDGA